MIATLSSIRELLVSPDDGSSVLCEFDPDGKLTRCHDAAAEFPVVAGVPVLLPASARGVFKDDGSPVVARRSAPLRKMVGRIAYGVSLVSKRNAERLVERLKERGARQKLLVIGGGSVGNGVEALLDAPGIEVVAFDVYRSAHTQFVADAHSIPIASASLDAVWIQAVLEHVVDPRKVVEEIHRVLRPGGLVYAETPFMQQVHERAYDFMRFTERGHRYLFRDFEEIVSGVVAGPGTALLWSISYFVGAVCGRRVVGHMAVVPFFWLRYFDHLVPDRHASDAASGFYFLGRSSSRRLSVQELIEGFRGV